MTTEQKTELRKEKARARAKAWGLANPEKVKAKNKAWNSANPDKRKALSKAHVKSKELDYYMIYCIPNHDGLDSNYVGVTSNPYNRMKDHKHLGKFNTEEYIELDRADTRAEAEELEAQYHDRGYDGAYGWESKKTI